MPRGVNAEYIALFSSRAFKEKNGGIYYYAERKGLELAYRKDLIPKEDDHARAAAGDGHAHLHPERRRERLEVPRIALRHTLGADGFPLDALEKNPGFHVAVLIGVEDVAPAREDPTGYAGDEAGLIGAVQEGDEGGGGHDERNYGRPSNEHAPESARSRASSRTALIRFAKGSLQFRDRGCSIQTEQMRPANQTEVK